MATLSFTTAEVTAGSTLVHTEDLSPKTNLIAIHEIKVTQNSAVGGVHNFGLFGVTSAPTGGQYYLNESWAGVMVDPVDDDDVEGLGGEYIQYRNEGGSGTLICKLWNNDSTDKAYAVDIVYDEIPDPAYLHVDEKGYLGLNTMSPIQRLDLRSTSAGTALIAQVYHTNNSDTGSHARIAIIAGGASGGDAILSLNVAGGGDWAIGNDNSDSDKLKIGTSTTIGVNTKLTIDPDDKVGILTGNPKTTLHSIGDTIIGTSGTAVATGLVTTGCSHIWQDESGANKLTIWSRSSSGVLYSGVVAMTAV